MKTLNGSEEVCVLRCPQEGWKERGSKQGVSKEHGGKNVCRGTRESQEEGTSRWKQEKQLVARDDYLWAVCEVAGQQDGLLGVDTCLKPDELSTIPENYIV